MLDSFFNTEPGSWLSVTAAVVFAAVFAGLLAIAIWVSLRYRQMLKHSQKSESQLRAVVDTAVDAIIMLDGPGLIRAINGAAETMQGLQV